MLFRPINRRGYSLVELLVVIGVITVVGIASVPNIFGRNDRQSLDSSAEQLRQIIIDARTRSQAPDKSDSAGAPQVFQVSLGKFTQAAKEGTATVFGSVTTNTVSLERGLVQCDSGDLQGGFTTLRSLSLPRGIYVSSFYPSNQTADDDRAVIRFTVGEEGFKCGSYKSPIYKSNRFILDWKGEHLDGNETVARYSVVALGSQKVGDKRYVTVDRVTREVAVSRSNPQSYFTPVTDKLAPKWDDVDPINFSMSVACGSSRSDIVISFTRAKDRVSKKDIVDENLFVAYDINWDLGRGSQPLAINYFFNLTEPTVRYQFSTDGFTNANQPRPVTVTLTAVDALGQKQPSTDNSEPDPLLKQRFKAFSPSCGFVISDPREDLPGPILDTDTFGGSEACNPIIGITKANDHWARKLVRLIAGPALAQKKDPCRFGGPA